VEGISTSRLTLPDTWQCRKVVSQTGRKEEAGLIFMIREVAWVE